MDLKEAASVAKQHVGDLFAAEGPQNIRLESFLYDDHLAVWTLTIGFALGGRSAAPPPRTFKVIRVSQVDKSVLSVGDR
ncbi:MAG TPA: hypothetical protein VG308_09845 [Stellaceae bacterium]|jgi:hypothetical protein|nr:hypothetical protein [Stellaceae bacterium]